MVERALLFLVGVGMIFGMISGVPARFAATEFQIEFPWPDFQTGIVAGCLMVILSLVLPFRKRVIEAPDHFDAEAQERWRLIEEEQERQRAKKDTAREERLQRAKSVKDDILANLKGFGFCEIKEDIRSLDEYERVPLCAKVHEIIPVIRDIATAQGIKMSYLFVMYDADIPTVNIELSFLDEYLTIGPQIPL
ncbi:MAG: hypothetical protein Q8R30_01650 [bacterium]|nr:hypothetical protein [bacterium]MDZ4285724.1 hypothetical protein [Candidatus Sungbacteria bacterium]